MPTQVTRRLLSLVMVAALGAAAGLAAASPASAAHPHPHQHRCRNGYVGLTFDDGPTPGTTTALLDALVAGGARATFFNWAPTRSSTRSWCGPRWRRGCGSATTPGVTRT